MHFELWDLYHCTIGHIFLQGALPLEILDIPLQDQTEAMFSNAQQILAQFKVTVWNIMVWIFVNNVALLLWSKGDFFRKYFLF